MRKKKKNDQNWGRFARGYIVFICKSKRKYKRTETNRITLVISSVVTLLNIICVCFVSGLELI